MFEDNEFDADEIEVRVDEDLMSAYMTVSPLDYDKKISVKELINVLNENNVTSGIKEDVLKDIIENKLFYMEYKVAEGEIPVFGTDGYYEIPFSFEFDQKPKINEDGSVDYNQFDNYCRVSEGDVIAIYRHGTKGKNGVDVQGNKIPGKNGKEPPPLRGKGFKVDESDGRKYIATMSGRLEYITNKSINISNCYEVDGDVNHATGNIQFPGDVHIRGNVTSGAFVKASGQIIVDGHVEASFLFAEQGIVLKNGVQGAGKGRIEAGGNISAKFFEQTVVRAKGTIVAGAVLNCDIESEEEIIISGKMGTILGGRAKAVSYIEANVLGNMAETKTFIKVGGGSELYTAIAKNDEEIEAINEEIKNMDISIRRIEAALKEKNAQNLVDKKMEMIRAKYKKTSELDGLKKRKKELLELMAKSEKSKITVKKSVYPGVSININDIVMINKSENFNVTYERRGGNVVAVPNI